MKSLKISQIQFEANSTPNENCDQLKKFYQIGNYSIISSSSIILTIFLPLITALTLAHS